MIVTVANHKGGVGKTTTVVTLAHLVADRHPLAVVDLDAPAAGKPAGAAQALRRCKACGVPAFTADDLRGRRDTPAGVTWGDVLIDTPPDAADPLVREALLLADIVLVPTSPAVDEIDVAAAFAADAAGTMRAGARLLLVLTRVPHYAGRQADQAAEDLRELLDGLPATVAGTRIPALAAFPEAAAAGVTVAAGRYVSWRRAARSYAALAAEIGW